MTGLSHPASVRAWCLCLSLAASMAAAQEQPFRPEPGKFPPLDKALAYRGELVFVDHANRRGSIRVEGAGTYFRNAPHPFAMLPYGVVRYHGAPAELRHIPLGTVLHVRGFLPPDPKNSPVPVFPVNNRTKNSGYSGAGTAPAENHVLLLEDEPSHCLREGLVWKLKEVEVQNNEGLVVATRAAKADKGQKPVEEKLTFDATTRLWRGRESLRMDEFIAEGGFPARARNRWTARLCSWGSTGNRRLATSSPGSTFPTSGLTMPRWNGLPATSPMSTRHSSAAAGCPPGSMLSSTASSDGPSSPPPCLAAWTTRFTPTSRKVGPPS
ncbi:MAG: hypothetical protein ACKO26_22170 [Planctomycetota bacterium]